MKSIWLIVTGACVIGVGAWAAETNEVEALRRQLREATENFERVVKEQRQTIDGLSKKLDALQQEQTPAARPIEATATNGMVLKTQAAQPGNGTSGTAANGVSSGQAWSASQPLQLFRTGSAYMNISFDALVDAGWSTSSQVSQELEQGHHDPLQRGFSLRNAEIALDGAVDPYFKGFANITMALDENNETELELEEAYLQTTSLPGNLQLKAGQFLAEFGRINPTHPHTWAFVDQPLVVTRLLGPDGLRNPGAQLSWLAPTPFYLEGFFAVMNGQGEQAFSYRNRGEPNSAGQLEFLGYPTTQEDLRGPGDLLFIPRVAASVDLTEQQTLLGGLSAAFGPNDTGRDNRTEIYGADVYWKWKSPKAHAGFPFVSLQAEGMYRRFEAGPDQVVTFTTEVLRDWGFYSQILWGFKEQWVLGLRGEYVNGNPGQFEDRFRGERTRVSPNITWYPSEFSKLRLQYNYDHGALFGDEHSVWLQMEFLLGAHGAHKF